MLFFVPDDVDGYRSVNELRSVEAGRSCSEYNVFDWGRILSTFLNFI